MIAAGQDAVPSYAELHCISNFTFLRGASHPEELVAHASKLGYTALALTDECSVAGAVRAHVAAREHGIKLIIGSEFRLEDELRVVLLAANRRAYVQLCTLITGGRRAASKGEYRLNRANLAEGLDDCLLLWIPDCRSKPADGHWLASIFPDRAWIALALLAGGDDRGRLHAITNLKHAGSRLYANGERHLRRREHLRRIYPPDLLRASVTIAERIDFSLDQLQYHYPKELVPDGHSPASYLRQLTEHGMCQRWPGGTPPEVSQLVEHELRLIAELNYEPYFLTVHDIVRFARERNILCQGRGSAANSAVCFCLGITEVDPARMSMLMERFISKERNEPPDIDVDFEHHRREEVIQYIYRKYGRTRAALTATVITYRPRSAIRDVGKALGLSELQVDRMARSMQWWDGGQIKDERIVEAGLDPANPVIYRLTTLVSELIGFPRHLSQHVGGFIISEEPLNRIVPVENAAMEDRTVIQWDKDDLDDLGLLKVDVLGLGMLSAIHQSFELINSYYGRQLSMATVPAEDAKVYDMICRADTMGVFQIESRAQMAMLPRLRPRCYYDLVIEVAIIRPGPIQGDMVHPYLRRRNGEEAVTYPSLSVQQVLERTLGVPIFQEQVMQLAIVAAGFSAGEADSLRRAMAAWKRRGGLGPFEQRLIEGMSERGYSRQFAQQIFNQIQGFGEYGFPESHAASFALLVYVSAWLKCHEPAAFTCALFNCQPMGFYAPAQLIQSARRSGVEVRSVDVNWSEWDCTLEKTPSGVPALRLGLRMVRDLSEQGACRMVQVRAQGLFNSAQDLFERTGLDQRDCAALAAADALADIAGHRHQARWQVAGCEPPLPLLPSIKIPEGLPLLKTPTEGQAIAADYNSLGLTLRRHPLALLREQLRRQSISSADELWHMPGDRIVHAAGLVVARQRPSSAKNVTFVTLEDETGCINLIVWEAVAERQRQLLLNAVLLGVWGRLQRQDGVMHVIASQLEDHSLLLGELTAKSRDFH
jgi:error-prone DNA polymerase